MSESEKIRIKIDPELAELIPAFLKNREDDLRVLAESLKSKDYQAIERIGHGMKGAGSGFGFDGVTEIGGRIEMAAKQKDDQNIQKHIQELRDYMQRVELQYE